MRLGALAVALLAVAALAAGCGTTDYTEYRVVSSTMPTRAPALRGSHPGADQGRLGGAVWWAATQSGQSEGSPEDTGGSLTPAGGANAWAGYGFSEAGEIGVGFAMTFAGSERMAEREVPFAPPTSRLLSGELGLRWLWPTRAERRVGLDIGFRVNELRYRWDFMACERSCNSVDVGGPYDERFSTFGQHIGVAFTSEVSDTATFFFSTGLELLAGIPPSVVTTDGLPPREIRAATPEFEYYVLPRGELGFDVDLSEVVRMRWTFTPAVAAPFGATQLFVLEAGLELLP